MVPNIKEMKSESPPPQPSEEELINELTFSPPHRQGPFFLFDDEAHLYNERNLGSMNIEEFLNEWDAELRQQGIQPDATNDEQLQREDSSEDMTLEDFLVQLGVVQEPSGSSSSTGGSGIVETSPTQSDQFGSFNSNVMDVPEFSNNDQNNFENNGMMVTSQTYPQVTNNGIGISSITTDGESSRPASDSGDVKRKRVVLSGPDEQVVERRQRRMMKNRESAARSRSRKQAYMMELEVEVSNLKDENAELRKAMFEDEKRRMKEYHQEMKEKLVIKEEKVEEMVEQKVKKIKRSMSSDW